MVFPFPALRENAVFIVGQNLVGGARALLGPAFHEALKVDGAVFAGEMDLPLAHALIAAEERILADEPAGVAAEQVGIARWIAQRSRAGVVLRRPRPDLFQLFDKGVGVLHNARIGGAGIWPVRLV